MKLVTIFWIYSLLGFSDSSPSKYPDATRKADSLLCASKWVIRVLDQGLCRKTLEMDWYADHHIKTAKPPDKWRWPHDGEWACMYDDCEHNHIQQWKCNDEIYPDKSFFGGPPFTEHEVDSIRAEYHRTHHLNRKTCWATPQ